MMETMNERRTVLYFETRIAAPATVVFPLLCPVREYDWIDGWECEVLYSASGVAENNCVFTTNNPERGGEAIWTVTRYEPENCLIQFSIQYPGQFIEKLDICGEETQGGTLLKWRRTYTALSESGQALLEAVVAPHIDLVMGYLHAALDHYCQNGAMLMRSEFFAENR